MLSAARSSPTHSATVIRSWMVQDGSYRAQVRQYVAGKTSSRCPVHEVECSVKPRDGSTVMIRDVRPEGFRIVE